MGRFIRHEPCPKCGSRDNLAVYDTNVYCFGCGYRKSENSIYKTKGETYVNKRPSDLPNDLVPASSSPSALIYCRSFGITVEEIHRNHIQFSATGVVRRNREVRPLLLFPLLKEGTNQMSGWIARNLSSTAYSTKWVSSGNLADNPIVIKPRNSLSNIMLPFVIVEDIISAIKVGRSFNAVPLFSKGCSLPVLNMIVTRASSCCVWLDRDAHDTATHLSNRIAQFMPCGVIRSQEDPKMYTQEEIECYVNRSIL